MAYNEQLSDRIREALADLPDVTEKIMFGGICYMVNGKMCIGVSHQELMCRIGPDHFEEALEMNGVRPMTMRNKVSKGFVFIDETGVRTKKEFDYWLKRCLDFNKHAKASKKKKPK
jgi:TfoX/Sxy family transcriptional regulator of competence genes